MRRGEGREHTPLTQNVKLYKLKQFTRARVILQDTNSWRCSPFAGAGVCTASVRVSGEQFTALEQLPFPPQILVSASCLHSQGLSFHQPGPWRASRSPQAVILLAPSQAAWVFSTILTWTSSLNMMDLLQTTFEQAQNHQTQQNQNCVIFTIVDVQFNHIPILLKEIFKLWFIHFMRQIASEELVTVRVSQFFRLFT